MRVDDDDDDDDIDGYDIMVCRRRGAQCAHARPVSEWVWSLAFMSHNDGDGDRHSCRIIDKTLRMPTVETTH